LVGRVHLCRPQKPPVERKRQWWLCLSRNQRLRHDRSTIRRRLEEAAGVEGQFEAFKALKRLWNFS
jgi:hypothetical protein